MNISELLQNATTWFGWTGLSLGVLTLLAFILKWGIRFRLIGTTIFTLLLSTSCWAFGKSYKPPLHVDGAKYVPVVYDNGYDLVVAQAPKEFSPEDIRPTLEQMAGSLKGGGRDGALVHVRIRTLEEVSPGTTKPVILGEVIRDVKNQLTIFQPNESLEK